MKKQLNNQFYKQRSISFWFPRLSIVILVTLLYAFLLPDLASFLKNYPLFFNFFFGLLVVFNLIFNWEKNKRAGLLFVGIAIIYTVVTWEKLLVLSTLFTAVWLFVTGILFLLTGDEKNVLDIKKEAMQKSYARDFSQKMKTR